MSLFFECILYIGTVVFFQHFTSNFGGAYYTQVRAIHKTLQYTELEICSKNYNNGYQDIIPTVSHLLCLHHQGTIADIGEFKVEIFNFLPLRYLKHQHPIPIAIIMATMTDLKEINSLNR